VVSDQNQCRSAVRFPGGLLPSNVEVAQHDSHPDGDSVFTGVDMGLWNGLKSIFGGDRLNIKRRFSVLSQASTGTMSKVFKVQEHATGKMFALKLLDRHKLAEYEDRFKGLNKPSEGEIGHTIQSPHVAQTFEWGETVELEPFVLMEYVDGATLYGLAGAKQPPGRLLALLRSAAQGLSAVHQAGFLHRDVCPHNFIAVRDAGAAKLIDFGLAIPMGKEFQAAAQRVGKVDYMAPELLRRQPTDQRVDIFAFGVAAFEVLSGHLPWEAVGKGLSSAGRMAQDIRKFRPKLHTELAGAIEGCLQVDPEKRWPTLEHFLREIRALRVEDAT
jgi:serine/threonine protein kinase